MVSIKIITYPPFDQLEALNEIEGKFVQFSWRGIQYLVFATKDEHRFHNQMLAHFLSDHGLPYRWSDAETLEIGADDLTVLGGGRFRFLLQNRRLQLWDDSQAYGRFSESGLAESIHAAGHPWSDATVEIQS